DRRRRHSPPDFAVSASRRIPVGLRGGPRAQRAGIRTALRCRRCGKGRVGPQRPALRHHQAVSRGGHHDSVATASRAANLHRQAKHSDSRQVGLSFFKLAKVSRDRAPLSEYTYRPDPQRLEIAKRPDNAGDGLGRLPGGGELDESPELLAPSAFAHRYLVGGLLPAYWPGAGGGQVPSRLLRRPVVDARHVRARPRTYGAT